MKTYALHKNELAQTVNLYLEAVAVRGSSPRTVENYSDVLRQFLFFAEQQGVTTLDAVTAEVVNRYLLSVKERPTALHTVRKHYATLRGFWHWALKQALVDVDIFSRVEKPKVDTKIKPALSMEQIERILRACDGKDWLRLRDRALVLVLLDTGARAQEVHRLTVADVYRDAIILRGKGAKERVAFLSPETKVAVNRYLRACPYKPSGEQPLWYGRYGALTWNGVLEVVEKIGERAGITPLGCHIFRRSFATWSLRAGIDLHRLQLLMGHSSPAVTQQYLHLLQDDLRQAHAKHSPLKLLRKK
ncbi:MAG: tyrosine-type recombinase/integrase [bacterium]|nr:tyrosine-type recombinase/integrase [bacterium]